MNLVHIIIRPEGATSGPDGKDYKQPEILGSELDVVPWWNFGLSPLCRVRG